MVQMVGLPSLDWGGWENTLYPLKRLPNQSAVIRTRDLVVAFVENCPQLCTPQRRPICVGRELLWLESVHSG